jgi:high affinity Mn2+ porin
LGVLVGDGKLPHPGAEKILETFYDAALCRWFQVTLDYQYVTNPGYNSDRGPVSVFAVRAHMQF